VDTPAGTQTVPRSRGFLPAQEGGVEDWVLEWILRKGPRNTVPMIATQASTVVPKIIQVMKLTMLINTVIDQRLIRTATTSLISAQVK
jgi:hypothetical protein